MKSVYKYLTMALAAGVLGGGLTYCGISRFNNNEIASQGGVTEVRHTNNVQSQAENAFQSVRNDVVSVVNLKELNNVTTSGLDNQNPNGRLQAASEGSGVIYQINGDQAYIVTNEHVVDGSKKLRIILSNGKKVPARVVGANKKDDLAVVKCSSDHINHVARFGNSDRIQAGETSLAIGSPLGATYASTVTQGIISNRSRKIKRVNVNDPQDASVMHIIQTDTAINPGNSGGPLIDLNGQVIGINSAKVASTPQGTSVEGMGFAIPSNEVVRAINRIVSHRS